MNDVLPASAGMIPRSRRSSRTPGSAPRIRGDDPDLPFFFTASSACSPHPRG